ncbi:MAG: ATPase [Xanthomonadales bacterium]|nr:ATPase [Xanthomonadales bacterium]NNL96179.1 ATPase [Xanthomonadales bacterium]
MKKYLNRLFGVFTLTPFLLVASPIQAEVTSVNASGFALAFEQTIDTSAEDIYTAMTEIGSWWHPDHSWEGKAENLYMDMRVGGCFCEKLANGGFAEHLHLAYAAPGKEIRLTGGLGPLQGMGMGGAMVWTITMAAEGQKISWTYTAHGHGTQDSMKGLAPIVDMVQKQAFDRLIRYIQTGAPDA